MIEERLPYTLKRVQPEGEEEAVGVYGTPEEGIEAGHKMLGEGYALTLYAREKALSLYKFGHSRLQPAPEGVEAAMFGALA